MNIAWVGLDIWVLLAGTCSDTNSILTIPSFFNGHKGKVGRGQVSGRGGPDVECAGLTALCLAGGLTPAFPEEDAPSSRGAQSAVKPAHSTPAPRELQTQHFSLFPFRLILPTP